MHTKLKIAKTIMYLAAAYNIFWGAVISLKPEIILFGNPPTDFLLIILQCIGMLVGVYGVAYYFAGRDPQGYWPLILVGFIGKLLGPIGSVYYIWLGKLAPAFFWVNVWNDMIWLVPFGWIIYQAVTGKLNEITQSDKSLYQQFLGDAFDSLSPNLKAFHQSKSPIKALGQFKVTRGTTPVCKVLANIAGMPANAEAAVAELIVTPAHAHEIWSRRLGDKKVISKQWLTGKVLTERFKIVNIYLKADVINGDLIIYDTATSILGIPMPRFFTPCVYATGTDAGDSIEIEVEIGFKPFGRIVNYKGPVKIQQLI